MADDDKKPKEPPRDPPKEPPPDWTGVKGDVLKPIKE
jgi:hypothetical protein